jgi:predicted alpha/beta hydrolase
MPPLERIKVLAMWHGLGPLLTACSGYLSWSSLRLVEDLPLEVYRQWKRWCRYPNFFLGDPAMQRVALGFARVRTPIMAANSFDDRWSPPTSRDAFMVGYQNARLHALDLDPAGAGVRSIGHMGYFKPEAVSLWRDALEWLER